jgi:hypothetical protein
LLVVGVLVSVNLGMGWKKEKSVKDKKIEPVEIYFYLSEKPLLNKKIMLVTTIIPNRDIGTASVEINLPEGITSIGTQSLSWQGNMMKGEFIRIPAKIKVSEIGEWRIKVEVKGTEMLKEASLVIGVTDVGASLHSEEGEYDLNPLPKDKFVFISVEEINETQELKVNKKKRAYIMPQFPRWDWFLVSHQDFNVDKNGIIRITMLGKVLELNGKKYPRSIPIEEAVGLVSYKFALAKGYDVANIIPINVIPSPLKLLKETDDFLKNSHQLIKKVTLGSVVRWDKPLKIVGIQDNGTVKIYHKEKKIILAPGEEWSEGYKIWRRNRYFKMRIIIKNYGLFEKNKIVVNQIILR